MVEGSAASAAWSTAARAAAGLDPALSSDTTLQTAGLVIALGTALGLVWRTLGRPVYRMVRRSAAFVRDWSGEPERPGRPRVPGVMERLRAVESELHGLHAPPVPSPRPEGSVRPDSAGSYGGHVSPLLIRERPVTHTRRLAPGDPAPDFALLDADGRKTSLASYRGRRVVVYFYPAAMTPGCTTEACDFRDSLDALAAAGIDVLGVSPDPPARLARFREQEGLTFPLLSDPDHSVLEAYGAWGEKNSYGRTSVGVIRSTVVVAPDGRVERALYNVKATGHVARLRTELGVD